MHDIIIIGGGPAGLTAATYARRAGKKVLILEKAAFGGQITWSPKVENFPGIVSASGVEIADRLLEQALGQGADVELEEAVSVCSENGIFTVSCASGAEFSASSLIIAVGAKPRTLGLEREEELTGCGVCYCAVCDGAFFAGKEVAVYGGGNSALQDALLLSETCSKVTLIHRRDSFRGEAKLVEAIRAKENVELMLNSTVKSLLGKDELTGLTVEQEGIEKELTVEGLFVAVGHKPDNGIFAPYMELDEAGYVASSESCLTKTPGVFAAGDCRAKAVRQCSTACADGAVAALAACSYLDS